MKGIYDTQDRFRDKTVYLQNFVRKIPYTPSVHEEYVFYFGRISPEKGLANILYAARELPGIPFVCAGSGPFEDELRGIPNLQFAGFKKGEALHDLIRKARLVILPSTCCENCPLSVIEAQMLGAAVIAPGYGGAAELIDKEDQLIDTSGSTLKSLIEKTYFDEKRLERMRERSLERSQNYLGTQDYIEKFLEIAEGVTRKG